MRVIISELMKLVQDDFKAYTVKDGIQGFDFTNILKSKQLLPKPTKARV